MAELALASLSVSLAASLFNLLSLYVKQERRNRANESRLEEAKDYTRQIRDKVSRLVKSGKNEDLAKFRPEFEKLNKSLPKLRADLGNASTAEDFDKVVEQLSRQADMVEDLSKQVMGSESAGDEQLEQGARSVLDKPPLPVLDVQQEPLTPRITITESFFEEFEERKPALIRLYSPSHLNVRADIIFVHGLNEDAKNTWSGRRFDHGRRPFYWPRDLLVRDLSDCAIWIYSFDANVLATVTPTRPLIQVLDQYTDDLVRCVRDNIYLDARKYSRHIIWVAHSLGGVLVKNALTVSSIHDDDIEAQLGSRTKSVLFLGTPHAGSSLPARVSRVTEIISSLSSKDIALAEDQSWAAQLHENSGIVVIASKFLALMDLQNFPVVSYFETDDVLTENGPRLMVEPFSRISHPNEICAYLEGNHHTMCKFDSEKERGYQQILKHLKKTLEEHDSSPRSPTRLDRSRPQTYDRTTLTDSEFTDVGTIYRRLRMRIDRPGTRWTSAKSENSKNGNWFLHEPEFSYWLNGAQRSSSTVKPLLITGPTGCGKTMVAESIIEELQKQSLENATPLETCQLQYFFKSGQTAQQSAATILVGFIVQLLDQNHRLARHLNRRAEELEDQSNDKLSRALLKGTIRRMLEDTCWKTVFVVIDGLDECSPSSIKSSCDIFSWMFDVNKVRMIFTSSDDIIPSESTNYSDSRAPDYSLYSELERELFERRLSFERIRVHEILAWNRVMKHHISKQLAFSPNEEDETNVWREVPTNYRLSTQRSLFEMVDISASSISFSLINVILQYLLYHNIPHLGKDVEPLPNVRVRELSRLANIYKILLDLVTKQERPAVNAICILACAVEPLPTSEVASLTHFMWSSKLLHRETLLQNTDDLKEKLRTSEMQALVTAEGDGLHLSRNLVRRALLSENSAGHHLQNNLVQRAILDQMASNDDAKAGDHDSFLPGDGDPVQHVVNFYLARACLRILIATETPKTRRWSPGRLNATFPGRAYAHKNWTAHLRGAGKLAVHLNRLVRGYVESPSTQNVDAGGMKNNADMDALKLLAHENLFENLGAAFADTDILNVPDPLELDTLLSDTKSLPEPEMLTRIGHLASQSFSQSSQLSRSSRSLRYIGWQSDRLGPKVRLVMSIKGEESEDFEELLRQFRPSHDEVIYLADIAIQEQNATALTILLEKYHHRLTAGSVGKLFTKAVQFQGKNLVGPMLNYPEFVDLQQGLVTAVGTANEAVCELLLAHGANVDSENDSGTTVLHLAAASGLQAIVILFLKWNASVNRVDKKGRTALHLAAEYGHASVIETLLGNSCSLAARDVQGRTAFFIACACGQKKIARILWLSDASLNDRDQNGRSPLHAAARKGQKDIVEMLLTAGIDPSTVDDFNITPLQEAAEFGWAPIAQLLIEKGADIMHRSAGGATALHFACTAENAPEAIVDLLLPKLEESTHSDLPDVKRADTEGSELSVGKHAGIKRGSVSVTKSSDVEAADVPLVKRADPTASDLLGRTPILLAGQFSTLRVLTRLLEEDPDLAHHKDHNGHGLRDYVTFPVHLTAEEERTLSESSKRKRIARREANQKEKMQFLEFHDVVPGPQSYWSIVELRDVKQAPRLRRWRPYYLSWLIR